MRLIVSLVVASLFAVPLGVSAQVPAEPGPPCAEHGRSGHGVGRGPGLERRIERMKEHLGLDDRQVTEVRRILTEARARREAARANAGAGSPPAPEARRRMFEETHGAIRRVLRADQQRIFDARVARMRERFGRGRGGAQFIDPRGI